jgi:hypothetical protein
VLDTELVNNAPASAFPGCNRTATIITMHARIKSPYKRILSKIRPSIQTNLSVVMNDLREHLRV